MEYIAFGLPYCVVHCTIKPDVVIILEYKPAIHHYLYIFFIMAVVYSPVHECNSVQQQENIAVMEVWACNPIKEFLTEKRKVPSHYKVP